MDVMPDSERVRLTEILTSALSVGGPFLGDVYLLSAIAAAEGLWACADMRGAKRLVRPRLGSIRRASTGDELADLAVGLLIAVGWVLDSGTEDVESLELVHWHPRPGVGAGGN